MREKEVLREWLKESGLCCNISVDLRIVESQLLNFLSDIFWRPLSVTILIELKNNSLVN